MIRLFFSNITYSSAPSYNSFNTKYPDILQIPMMIIVGLIMQTATYARAESTLDETVPTIHGYTLEFRLTEGGTTQYNKLFNTLKEQGLHFDLKIRPLKRIMRDFENGDQPICGFPTSKNAIAKSAPNISNLSIIISDPVDQISLRIFTRPNSPKISSIEQLKGKRIAVWNGLNPKILLQGIEAIVETTPDELVRVKMLEAGRIDVILGFTPDVILAAQQLNLPEPHFDEKLALFRDEGASLVCRDSPENRALIQEFNSILKELKQNGLLQEILGPHVEIAL